METPSEWPQEVRESFDPIRILGKGGFASVVLAREKVKREAAAAAVPSIKKKVAIKAVGCTTNNEENNLSTKEERQQAILYARREIEILQHLHHPNVVQLYHHWITENNDRDNEHQLTAAILVLEYAKGPTVESLLRYGGALSSDFGRLVIAQTMDAVAYLHYRAVLHRDIKPDNIIVTGAVSSDSFIWDNDYEGKEDNSLDTNNQLENGTTVKNWNKLLLKYKVTLIDFGFARALTPSDMTQSATRRKPDQNDFRLPSYHGIRESATSRDSSQKSTSGIARIIINLDLSRHRFMDRSFHSRSDDELSMSTKSATHKMKRTMSTLGNRNFAAPEIVNKVRLSPHRLGASSTRKKRASKNDVLPFTEQPITETISNYVADYGLLVDSYSMGHTIRYMMTGAQPGVSVKDAIQRQKQASLISWLCCKSNGSQSGNKLVRSVRYRKLDDLPGVVYKLIKDLTELSTDKRISIRKARRNVFWISDVFEASPSLGAPRASSSLSMVSSSAVFPSPFSEEQLHPLDEISYLPFAISDAGTEEEEEEEETTPNAEESAAAKSSLPNGPGDDIDSGLAIVCANEEEAYTFPHTENEDKDGLITF